MAKIEIMPEKSPPKMDLQERLLEFGVQIIIFVGLLPRTLASRHIAGQLLRSGTAPGAHYEEAQGAESRADFIHKLQIALKELRETIYWLKLISKAKIVSNEQLEKIMNESLQLRAMIAKSVVTAKEKSKSSLS